jgi:hypothetical protein
LGLRGSESRNATPLTRWRFPTRSLIQRTRATAAHACTERTVSLFIVIPLDGAVRAPCFNER